MKQNCTLVKSLRTLLLLLCCLFSAGQVMAQYIATQLEAGKYYTGMAKDNSNNIYVLRLNSVSNKYEVARYFNGDPANTTVIHGGLDFGNISEYPWGITVNDNGDVFVVDPETASGWKIIKLPAGGGAPITVQQSRYFSALAVDNQNNLLTLEYNSATGKYRVWRYPAGNETALGTELYAGVTKPAGATSYPWGLVVDAQNNIYFTDYLENSGGQLLKLTAPGYTPSTLASNRPITALAIDDANNIYTIEQDGVTAKSRVMKYIDPTQAGTQLYTGLTIGSLFYPWGLAISNGYVYVTDGAGPDDGRVLRLSSPTSTVTSVVRATPNPTNAATVQYTVTFSSGVDNVTTNAFSLTTNGVTGTAITSVTGSGTTYTVTVNTGANDGTLRLNVTGTGIANTITNAPYTTGEVYTVDRTPPAGSLVVNGGALFTNNPSVTLTNTVTDADVSTQMQFSNDGVTYSSLEPLAASKSWTLSGGEGLKTVYMRALDGAGNSATFQDQITLDITPPNTLILSNPPAVTSSTNATFNFSASETASFQVSLDGAAFAPVSNPVTFPGLAAGPHTISVRAVDQANNIDPTPAPYSWTIDQTAPAITAVAVPANGYYKAGDVLNFTVEFSENVTVNTTTGTPYLEVTIGATNRQAVYISGTGTNQLIFRYTVQPGDLDLDGIALGPNIQLNSGAIADAAGNNALLALNSVAPTTGVFVNTSTPSVVLSTPALLVNAPFTVTITFSEAVTGLTLTDLILVNASVSNLATTDNITYTATVTPTVSGPVSISVPADAAVNIGNNGNAASNVLTVTYDVTAPAVTSVDVPANGTYKTGDVLGFTVHYNENVLVNATGGTPSLTLIIGAATVSAVYTGGTGTNALSFSYTVQTGNLDGNGIAITPNTVVLNGATLRDAIGNNAALPLAGVGNMTAVLVDAVSPAVTAVAVPANGYYKAGDVLNFTVEFSENVTVNTTTGTPYLEVTIGATNRQAAYISGTGTNQLIFRYTVQSGDLDLDGIALGANIQLNSGAIADAVGNNALLTLNNVASTAGVFVNTSTPSVVLSTPALLVNAPFTVTITFSEAVTGFALTDLILVNAGVSNLQTMDNITYTALITPTVSGPVSISVPANAAVNIGNNGNAASNVLAVTYDVIAPAVTSVDVPANGTYKAGDVLGFTVHYNENVLVNTTGGTPSLTLIIGAATVPAVYTGGTGTNALFFSYTVQTGNLDGNGIAITPNTLVLNGGTIRDAATNNADVVLQNPGNMTAVLVDAVAPVVTSVSVPANGYYQTGNALNFTVHFSENVTVNTGGGIPYFEGFIGAATVHAAYVSGSGSNALLFRYTVQAGEQDLDGISTDTTLVLNGGVIHDMVSNNAVPSLKSIGATNNVFVYSVVPAVTLSGVVQLNAAWTLTITFTEAVTGFTLVDLTAVNATVSNLQTTDNITYTALVTPVANGLVSLRVLANVAVNVGGNGNTASNQLSYTYDGTAPAITSVSVPPGYYKAGDVLTFTVNWSENVNINTVAGIPSLPVTIGTTGVQAVYTGGTGTSATTFAYTVQNGQMDLDGISLGAVLSLNGSVIRDLSLNNAVLTVNNPATTGAFVNTAHPGVTLTSTAADRVNAPFTVTLTFNEAVTGLTVADLSTTNATAGNLQTTDNITYTVLITPVADGAVNVSLPADAAINTGNNGNTVSNVITRTYDVTPPLITAGQQFTISQFSPVGALAGTVTATEAVGSLQGWAIATDGSGGAFAIDANGAVTVKDAAVLGTLAGTTITLGFKVSDGLNTSAAVPVTIQVIFVNQAPVLDPITDVTVCAATADPRTIQLTGASATEPGQTYTITASSAQDLFEVLTVSTANVLSYKLKSSVTSGSTVITVTIRDNGGTADGGVDALSRTFTLTVNALPAITITSNKGTSVSKGDEVQLTATGGATYSWADADGITGGQQTAILQIKPQANTTYQVTATSAAGCVNTASINIAVIEDFKVEATNILTPNGDGINDKWVVRNLESYPDNEVKIFDRAGRIVYSRRNYSNDWDGTINGSPLAEGTYYYMLTIGNGAKTAKGYITIVRSRY